MWILQLFSRKPKPDDDSEELPRIVEDQGVKILCLEDTVKELWETVSRLERDSGRPLQKHMARRKFNQS